VQRWVTQDICTTLGWRVLTLQIKPFHYRKVSAQISDAHDGAVEVWRDSVSSLCGGRRARWTSVRQIHRMDGALPRFPAGELRKA